MVMTGSQADLTGILQHITTTITHPCTPTRTLHTITPNRCTIMCRSYITRTLIPGGEQTFMASVALTTLAALIGPIMAVLAPDIRKNSKGQIHIIGLTE